MYTRAYVAVMTSLVAIGFFLLPATTHAESNICFKGGPLLPNHLTLVEGSTFDGSSILVTPKEIYKFGAVNINSRFSAWSDLHVKLVFRSMTPQGSPGGEGIAFVMHNDPRGFLAIGSAGDGIGYGDAGGGVLDQNISPSVTIEFDTSNTPGRNDPSDNHIGIMIDGNPTHQLTGALKDLDGTGFVLKSNSLHYVWMDYIAATNTLSVFISDVDRKPGRSILSATIDLDQMLGSSSYYIGITASTGMYFSAHEVFEFYASNEFGNDDPALSCCNTDSDCVGSMFGQVCDLQKHACGECSVSNVSNCPQSQTRGCDLSPANNVCLSTGCQNDNECPSADAPVCRSGSCVACAGDDGSSVNPALACLPEAPYCSNTGYCGDCTSDADCTASGAIHSGSRCHKESGRCGQCSTSADCNNTPNTPVCSSEGQCVPCGGNHYDSNAINRCPSSKYPACVTDISATDYGQCVWCVTDEDCLHSSPQGNAVCNTSGSRFRQCASRGCNGNYPSSSAWACKSAERPICIQGEMCIACASDSSLSGCGGTTAFCDATFNTCVGCGGDYGSGAPNACPTLGAPVCLTEGDSAGLCVQCLSSNLNPSFDCPSTAPFCDDTSNTCKPCNGAYNSGATQACPTADEPFCQSGRCVPCAGDEGTSVSPMCPEDAPYCTSQGNCDFCASSLDCKAGPAFHSGDVCDTDTGRCIECLESSDCEGATPICDVTSNTCVKCESDNGSSGDNACPTTDKPLCLQEGTKEGSCVACTLEDATLCEGTATPRCEPNDYECVQCNENSDCQGTMLCNPASSTCVECVTSEDCSGTTPVCDIHDNVCVSCDDDKGSGAPGECPTFGEPVCLKEGENAGSCVECLDSDRDCEGTMLCNPTSNTCVECITSEDCKDPSTPVCSAEGKCVGCVEDYGSGEPGACQDAAYPACVKGKDDPDQGKCVQCSDDLDCENIIEGGICDLSTHTCENPCEGDLGSWSAHDCQDPERPICLSVEGGGPGTCVPCSAGKDDLCEGTAPVCDEAIHTCVPCDGDKGSGKPNECPISTAPVCIPEGEIGAGACVPCDGDNGDSEATHACAEARPVCIPEGENDAGSCVECSSDKPDVCPGSSVCNMDTNTCVECRTDMDCGGTTPICDAATKKCEPCDSDHLTDSENACPNTEAPACITAEGDENKGACVQCSETNLSACEGTTPVCDTHSNTCVECDGDNGSGASNECPTTEAPACLTTEGDGQGACVECSSTNFSACDGTTPVCDTVENECVKCEGDHGVGVENECPTLAAPVCITAEGEDQGKCVECSSGNPGACQGSLVCDVTNNTCVECLTSDDCSGMTPICDTDEKKCEPCNGDHGSGSDNECPSQDAPLCVTEGPNAGSCAECATSSDCEDEAAPVCNSEGKCVPCDGDYDSAASDACSNAAYPACVMGEDDPDQGKCVPCNDDADCSNIAEGGFCDVSTHTCTIVCDGDYGSASEHRCTNSERPVCLSGAGEPGTCVPCSAAKPNLCEGTAPFCDDAIHTCVPCGGNYGDSTASFACGQAAPVCVIEGPDAGSCVECLSNADCDEASPVCNAAGTCVICDGDYGSGSPNQCSNAAHPICLPSGNCVSCTADKTGVCEGTTPFCDGALNICVPCDGDYGNPEASFACGQDTPHCLTSGKQAGGCEQSPEVREGRLDLAGGLGFGCFHGSADPLALASLALLGVLFRRRRRSKML